MTILKDKDNIKDSISALEKNREKLLIWFSNNEMKLDPVKSHYCLISNKNILKMRNFNIKNSLSEKPLGVDFVYKIKFNIHIEEICNKVSRNLDALARLTKYIHGFI